MLSLPEIQPLLQACSFQDHAEGTSAERPFQGRPDAANLPPGMITHHNMFLVLE